MTNEFTIYGIKYYCTDSVKHDSFETIKNAISRTYRRSTKNKDFFNDIKIQIFGSWQESDYPEASYFTRGIAMDPVAGEGKSIRLVTNKSFIHDITALFDKKEKLTDTEHYSIHELGHIFDNYFAKPNEQLLEQLKYIYKNGDENDEVTCEKFNKLWLEYIKDNSLSDTNDFKEAWKTDIEKAFKGKSERYIKSVNKKLGEFALDFEFDFGTIDGKLVNAADGINEEEIELSDRNREEVFAQLFAYALGTEYPDKRDVLNVYQNTYKIVKKYIREYLGIDCEEHKPCERISRLSCEA